MFSIGLWGFVYHILHGWNILYIHWIIMIVLAHKHLIVKVSITNTTYYIITYQSIILLGLNTKLEGLLT
jgi:hypothetical protein